MSTERISAEFEETKFRKNSRRLTHPESQRIYNNNTFVGTNTNEYKKIFKFELTNSEYNDEINLNMEIKKTNIPDVYKLYSIFHYLINGKDSYIKKRIGSAYVPTYVLSLKCKTYFMNRDVIIMNCKFDSIQNKWIPIEEASVNKIHIINHEKRLKITEELIKTDNDADNADNIE